MSLKSNEKEIGTADAADASSMTTHVLVGLFVLLVGCANDNHGNLDARGFDDDSAVGGGRDFTHNKGVETFSANHNQPMGIAVDDQYVYWATPAAVMRKKKSGGEATKVPNTAPKAQPWSG